tara:strand:- start:294 stop:1148 length:855 start_codon:yes stop_codon:yes gene_type:complete
MMRAGREAWRRELQNTTFRSLRHLRASGWFAYLNRVYGAETLQFPFALSHVEFFYTSGASRLPRHFYNPEDSRHAQQVEMTPAQGDVFRLAEGPPNTLFVYLHPTLGPYVHVAGKGRRTPPFAYSHGFPSYSKVEVVHTGRTERSARCGYWMYLARGSGMYLDLGRTMVFPEQWDALLHYTDCETAGNCSAYVEPRTTIVDGQPWTHRPFRPEIYSRALAQGVDTLQFTHRSEGVYRFEIVDLRLPGGLVTDACGFRPALSSGWQGTAPCACDARKSVLNCAGN